MPDLLAFGPSHVTVGTGFAEFSTLLTWEPDNPREIPPGDYDAIRTALSRVYYLWSRNPLWLALAEFIGEQFVPLVTGDAKIQEGRELANACGQALDDLGAIVGLPRMGLGCLEYRAAIRVRGASLLSDGTIPEILAIIEGLFGEDAASGAYVPWYPAGFALYVPTLSAADVALLEFLLVEPIPSGVGLTLVVTDDAAPGHWYTGADDTWVGARWGTITSTELDQNSTWAFGVQVG